MSRITTHLAQRNAASSFLLVPAMAVWLNGDNPWGERAAIPDRIFAEEANVQAKR